MEFRGKNDSSSSSAQHHQQQQQQYQPPTQSHASQRHRRRTTSANNSLEHKKNAKNEAASKDQYPLLPGSTKEEAVVVAVTSGTPTSGTTISPEPSQGVTRSGISSRQSLGETPTSSRADDCDVDSHADGEDYFDAESGLSSPDPPVKPQVTIHVEKSIDADEPVLASEKVCSL